MVWDRVLSASEIQSTSGDISDYQDDNLKVRWALDEGLVTRSMIKVVVITMRSYMRYYGARNM